MKCCKKNTVFSDDFSKKMTTAAPKSVSWRSNREKRSICAGTVSKKYTKTYFIGQGRSSPNIGDLVDNLSTKKHRHTAMSIRNGTISK